MSPPPNRQVQRAMIDISRVPYEHYPLRKVLMHRPETELASVTAETLEYFNFAAVPNSDRFLQEFDGLVAALQSLGTEVLLVNEILKDDPEAQAYIRTRANMLYTRDLAVVTPQGGILMGMAIDGRKGDPAMIGRVFDRLGIPTLGQLEPDGKLEGGGVSYFRGDTVIVGQCDRTNPAGLARFEAYLKQAGLRRLVTIPCPGTVHIDGFLVFIDRDLAIADPTWLKKDPAIVKDLETGQVREQMMMDFLEHEEVDLILLDPQDEGASANFVMTAPRQVVGFEWAEKVMRLVEAHGGKAVGVPGRELDKGKGGPHCMTCVLERSFAG